MKHLFLRLERETKIDADLKIEITTFFRWGIFRITNPALKRSLENFFIFHVPWQFFVEPMSKAGKHHPRHHNTRGGIVRHITESCVLADKMLEVYGCSDERGRVSPQARDIVLAATLLSDSFKNGNPWGKNTLPNHGEIAAEMWKSVALLYKVPDTTIKAVCEGSSWHLGRFTSSSKPKPFQELPDLVQIVHLLDSFSAARALDLIYSPLPHVKT